METAWNDNDCSLNIVIVPKVADTTFKLICYQKHSESQFFIKFEKLHFGPLLELFGQKTPEQLFFQKSSFVSL